MRGRVALLLGVLLVALMAAPQFTAAPGGIGSAGDQGCTCHGGASPDTTVLVDGLPETYNASETYTFTVTVQNDVMDINDVDWNGRAGGFRILASHGDITAVPESHSQMMDGGLTHTDEANTLRSWTFEWTAPAADDLNVEMTIYGNAVNGGNGAAATTGTSLRPPSLASTPEPSPQAPAPWSSSSHRLDSLRDSSSWASSGCSTDAPPRPSPWSASGASSNLG